MPNDIAVRQNDPERLRHFAASRIWYKRAARVAFLQSALAVGVPLCAAAALLRYPGDATRAWTVALAVSVALMDMLVLEPLQRRYREKGAGEQEWFDCRVLQLSWPEGIAGPKPGIADTLEAVHDLESKDAAFSQYRDWYPTVGALPAWLGALLCQRCNTWWDARSRRIWRGALRTAAVLTAGGVLAAGLYQSRKVEDLIITVYAPLSPLVLWCMKEERRHRNAAALSERGWKLVDARWGDALARRITQADESALREVQNSIYMRRRSAPMIPSLLHRAQRWRYLELMQAMTKKMIEEAREAGLAE